METLKTNWKRYLISSLITFLATFLLIAVPELLDDNFQWSGPAVAGVFLAALRLGLKAVWEIARPLLVKLIGK